VQLSVLLGVIVLLKAAAYWFDRYHLALNEGKLITGLTYTDVNAVLPAKAILAGIAVICSLLFFANIIRRSWVLPSAGVALLVISSVLIAGVYPGVIQQFQVKPSESSKEAPFIQKNIDATRAAYDLTGAKVTDYQATISTSAGQLSKDAPTISNIRLMDPNVISSTFRQLQQIKPYYTFPASLDIDSYKVKGVERDEITKRVTQIGDIILAINDIPINNSNDLNTILKKFKPGDKIIIKHMRINKEYNTDLVLGNYKGTTFTMLENERGKNFENKSVPVDIPLKNLEPVIQPKLN
jgi:uncharacterized membrane protein (UPF0182 family)